MECYFMYSSLTVYLYHIFDVSLNDLFVFSLLLSFVESLGISISHSYQLPSEGIFLRWEIVQLLTTQTAIQALAASVPLAS